jgi:proteasome lid subunit RPN8/RPN11
MTWKELPPDFTFEPIATLFQLLRFTDTFAICQYNQGDKVLVLLDQSAEQQAQNYVLSRPVESGGLLLGRTFINSGEFKTTFKYIVAISGSVCADDAHGTATALRMESNLWTKAGIVKQPNEFVVGWFHSHPNLGAFFSGTDRRTQASFFNRSHNIGWVIDPVRREEAWFVGPESCEISKQLIVRSDYSMLNNTQLA